MERFVGREQEMKELERAFVSTKSEFIPVYGRRRVGKSELIKHFMHGKNGIYYLGKKATASLQIKEFLQKAAELSGKSWLAEIAVDDWKKALQRVVEECLPAHTGAKLIIAVDEFQWTCGASPELPSILQELWDLQWKRNGRILLIICGSYIGFMEREILGRKSPLYGRRTAQILLKPFRFVDAAKFHPSWSLENNAIAWYICGGIPYYLDFFDENRSIDINIQTNLLSEHSALFAEPDFLLREELRELPVYNSILTVLGAGICRISQIAEKIGVPETTLGYYIQQLQSLGYINRRYPLAGDTNKKSREMHIVLEEPLLRFWFRFVRPNMDNITYLGPQTVYATAVRPQLEAYFGLCFERLCREALPYFYKKEGVTVPFQIGEYWDRDMQIDVVGVREDRWIDLCECSWSNRPAIAALSEELLKKCEKFPNSRNFTVRPRIFVKGKPKSTKIPQGTLVHTLKEMYDVCD